MNKEEKKKDQNVLSVIFNDNLCSFDLLRCDELSGTEDSVRFTCKAGVEGFPAMNQIDLLNLFFYSVTKNDEKYQPALISLEQWLLSENFMLLLSVKRFVLSFVLAVLLLVVLKKNTRIIRFVFMRVNMQLNIIGQLA